MNQKLSTTEFQSRAQLTDHPDRLATIDAIRMLNLNAEILRYRSKNFEEPNNLRIDLIRRIVFRLNQRLKQVQEENVDKERT